MDRRDLLSGMVGAGLVLASGKELSAHRRPAMLSASDPRFHQDYLDARAGQIYYWTAGQGPNLVLVHQSGNSSEEYAGLVPLLADRFRLIAMDLPGHGRSDDPASEPTVDTYTSAVQEVLDHLTVDRAHLLGHHGGSLTAMNLLAREPGRFDKAILSGTGGLRSEEENRAFIESIMSIDKTVRAESDFVAKTWERYMEMRSDGASAADMLRPFLAFLEARLRPYQGVLVNLKWDRREALSKLQGPILLVQGEKDSYVHGQESLLDVIPKSTRVVLPGCGTFMFHDRPDACADMVASFLLGE